MGLIREKCFIWEFFFLGCQPPHIAYFVMDQKAVNCIRLTNEEQILAVYFLNIHSNICGYCSKNKTQTSLPPQKKSLSLNGNTLQVFLQPHSLFAFYVKTK